MDPIQNQANMGGEGKKSVGSIIGLIVVVIVVALAVFYFWGGSKAPEVEEVVLPAVSTSDEVDSINADLGADTGADIDLNIGDIESTL